MPDTQTILLILLAVMVGGKTTVFILTFLSRFVPALTPLLPFLEKLAGNGKNGEIKEDTPAWAKQLQQHYNEDTTAELKNMNKTLQEIKEENMKHHKFEEGKFELLEEIMRSKK